MVFDSVGISRSSSFGESENPFVRTLSNCSRCATPLHSAALNNDPGEAEALIAEGITPEVTSPCGSTPLHYTAALAHDETSDVLLRAGADGGALDNSGTSPVLIATCMKQRNWRSFRESTRASTDVAALAYAQEVHHRQVIALFTEAGGTTTINDYHTNTPRQVELEGEYGGYCAWRKVYKGLRAFQKDFPKLLSERRLKVITMAITQATHDQSQKAEQLYAKWNPDGDNLPILLNTGYKTHFCSVLIWRNRIVHCDRARKKYFAGQFPADKMSSAVIQEIIDLKNNELETYRAFFPNRLVTLLNLQQGPTEQAIEEVFLPKLQVDNCTAGNTLWMVLPFLILSRLFSYKDYEQIERDDLKAMIRRQSSLFESFKVFIQYTLLNEYMTRKQKEINGYPPDLDLLARALNCIKPTEGKPQKLQEIQEGSEKLYHILYGEHSDLN